MVEDEDRAAVVMVEAVVGATKAPSVEGIFKRLSLLMGRDVVFER